MAFTPFLHAHTNKVRMINGKFAGYSICVYTASSLACWADLAAMYCIPRTHGSEVPAYLAHPTTSLHCCDTIAYNSILHTVAL